MPGVLRPTNLSDDQGTGVSGAILVGSAIIAMFFGGLVVWAAMAPLESAAIAPGVVSVDTNRKTIQHLEGGIVGAILVRDGEVVYTAPFVEGTPLSGRKVSRRETGLGLAFEAIANHHKAQGSAAGRACVAPAFFSLGVFTRVWSTCNLRCRHRCRVALSAAHPGPYLFWEVIVFFRSGHKSHSCNGHSCNGWNAASGKGILRSLITQI